MSADKLPPDGYELEPWWEVGGGFCCTCRHWKEESVYRHDPLKRGDADASCGRVECAIAMGAIVRKAEAPTACDVCGDPEPHVLMVGECFTRTEEEKRRAFPVAPAAPPEQPSGNPGELGAEAPAAPVAEPVEARHLAHAFVTANRLDCEKERPSPEPRPEHFPLCDRLTDVIQRAIDPRDARIAALEAELAEAKRGTLVVAETAYGATQAAVQAERERCIFHVACAINKAIGHRTALDRIKNGDPAP